MSLASKAWGLPRLLIPQASPAAYPSLGVLGTRGWESPAPSRKSTPQAITGRQASWGWLGICCVIVGPLPPATAGPRVPGAPNDLLPAPPSSTGGHPSHSQCSGEGQRRAQEMVAPILSLTLEAPGEGTPPSRSLSSTFCNPSRTEDPSPRVVQPFPSVKVKTAALPSPEGRQLFREK